MLKCLMFAVSDDDIDVTPLGVKYVGLVRPPTADTDDTEESSDQGKADDTWHYLKNFSDSY